ncbi:DUF2922 domain-containing protein [Candidatus Clostridium radicumherbarum]|uniref:DUF2922 domain-containing protein n=1 Tax=Candidatus Clostridium radicumherbarum TaxID=3381662 RepID=A0ABW8TQV1_9CLOT
MAEKSLVMTFLNELGSRASITLAGVRDDITQNEVSAAMDVIIAKNIFKSSGGNLVTKHSAQITEKNVTALEVR